jgi:YVTN family beta-propeller protein
MQKEIVMRTPRTIKKLLRHPKTDGRNDVCASVRLVVVVRNVLKLALMTSCLLASSAQAQQFAYVTNSGSSSVSVVDTATNTVKATIGVGARPIVALTPDGSRVYVANS